MNKTKFGRVDELNRTFLERNKNTYIASLEKGQRKDSLKQLDSGLNHVLAKIASKNNISINLDLEEIKRLGKKEKAIRLARIIQNIKICRKNNTKIGTIGGEKDAFFLMLSLGASTRQAKEASQSF